MPVDESCTRWQSRPALRMPCVRHAYAMRMPCITRMPRMHAYTVPQAALAKAPGNLKATEETLKPIVREINYKRTGKFDEASSGVTLEEFKSIAWSTAVSVRQVDVGITAVAFAAKLKGSAFANKLKKGSGSGSV